MSVRVVAVLLLLKVAAGVAYAQEPGFPPLLDVRLSGGASYRNSQLATRAFGIDSVADTSIGGLSPTFLRLDAAGWFHRYVGIEGEGSVDIFALHRENTQSLPGRRAAGRLAVAARWVTDSGFSLFGALGFGVSAAPAVRAVDADTYEPLLLMSYVVPVRVGVGLTKGLFSGDLSVAAQFPVAGRYIIGVEPRLWAGVRLFDFPGAPLTLWLGADVGMLFERSFATTAAGASVYSGETLRFALSVRLTLNSPEVPKEEEKPIEVDKAPGVVLVRVKLPDGSAAVGARVTIDGAEPVVVTEDGVLRVEGNGVHRASASLPGYRDVAGEASVAAGEENALELSLMALTGPGRLSGVVRAAGTDKPMSEVTVTAGEASARTGEDGAYVFEAVGPGPVQVRAEAQGFNVAEEVAQVPPEGEASLDLALEPLGKGFPATVRGLVRTHSGKVVKTQVMLKGGRKPRAVPLNAEGRFVLTLPSGVYTLVISAKGYVSQTQKLSLADGEQAIVHVELLEARGR